MSGILETEYGRRQKLSFAGKQLTRNKDVRIIDHYRAAGPIGSLFAPR